MDRVDGVNGLTNQMDYSHIMGSAIEVLFLRSDIFRAKFLNKLFTFFGLF